MTTIDIKVKKVPYEDLTLGTEHGFQNPRTVTGLGAKDIADLAASIETDGLKDELVVWPYEKDKVTYNIILRGQRRYHAIGKLLAEGRADFLKEGVPVKFEHCATMAEAEVAALLEFAQSEGISTPELAEAIERLRAQGYNQRQIADKLKRSETWVSRIGGAYHKAVPELREAWRDGKIPDDSAKELAAAPRDEQAKKVAKFLEARAEGTRESKAKARDVAGVKDSHKGKSGAKGKTDETKALPPSHLEAMHDRVTKALVANGKANSAEIEAMRLTLLWALGKLNEEKLPLSYQKAAKKAEELAERTPRVGDVVTWKSQANGKWKQKVGKVIEVVPVGKKPTKFEYEGKRRWESYVIDVEGELYYPLPTIVAKAKEA